MSKPVEEKAAAARTSVAEEDVPNLGSLIRLSSLPPHVAAKLAKYDKDGDGTLDWSEVFSGALGACPALCTTAVLSLTVQPPSTPAHEESVRKTAAYAKGFFVLLLVWSVQLACNFGVVFGVVSYAKDSAKLTPQDPVRGWNTLPSPPASRAHSILQTNLGALPTSGAARRGGRR
jgi:hypothetical protein